MTEPAPSNDRELLSKVRVRQCPGCKNDLEWYDLTALMLPIEQATIHALKEANRSLSWSVRTSGEMNIGELQFLAFASVCEHCSLISHWDFGTEELEAILELSSRSPTKIKWNHNPKKIAWVVENAPEKRKDSFQRLLDILQPKGASGK